MNWNYKNNLLSLRGLSGIYIFRNRKNGKVYIGQSVDIYNRYRTHKIRREKTIFSKVLHKVGFENFDFGVLEPVRKLSELSKREEFWIEYYKSYKRENGYNQGRYANPFKRKKLNISHREKISKALKGIDRKSSCIKSVETKRNIGCIYGGISVRAKHIPSGKSVDFQSTNKAARLTGVPRRNIGYAIKKFDQTKEPQLMGEYLWEKI